MTGAGPACGPRRLDPGYSITRVRPGVLALAGEFDACNAHALQSALADLIASGAGCVLDAEQSPTSTPVPCTSLPVRPGSSETTRESSSNHPVRS